MRLANETLEQVNTITFYYSYTDTEPQLSVRYSFDFEKSLRTLNLSKARWESIATHIFYISVILDVEYDLNNPLNLDAQQGRKNLINATEWYNEKSKKRVNNALNYYHISIEEWVNDGYYILFNHHLFNTDLKNYGEISLIEHADEKKSKDYLQKYTIYNNLINSIN